MDVKLSKIPDISFSRLWSSGGGIILVIMTGPGARLPSSLIFSSEFILLPTLPLSRSRLSSSFSMSRVAFVTPFKRKLNYRKIDFHETQILFTFSTMFQFPTQSIVTCLLSLYALKCISHSQYALYQHTSSQWIWTGVSHIVTWWLVLDWVNTQQLST